MKNYLFQNHKVYYFLTPALLAVLMFASNFLSADLFKTGFQNFTVWFVLSIFAFACGWLMNKTLGYTFGGKVLFAVIVVTAFFSNIMVLLFNDYFGFGDAIYANLVLYALRNIVLGAMGLFGMAISELIMLQKEVESQNEKVEGIEKALRDSQKEAELILEEAKIRAEKMLFEADKRSHEMIERKKRIEIQLKEFIQAEKELINKYESDEK